jgi:hypothetical protein
LAISIKAGYSEISLPNYGIEYLNVDDSTKKKHKFSCDLNLTLFRLGLEIGLLECQKESDIHTRIYFLHIIDLEDQLYVQAQY